MLTFKQLRLRNFLSFEDETTLDLNTSKKTLVQGSNGSGKSSIPTAICYVLFNKTPRKVNLPQLVNFSTNANCVVELDFVVGTEEYTVRRGQKPAVFEIIKNGKRIDQESTALDYQRFFEEKILKTDFKTFSSVVTIGGKSYQSFMNQTKQDRRRIIESLLDIDVFSMMNAIAKSRLLESESQVNSTRTLIQSCQVERDVLKQALEQNKKTLEKAKVDKQAKIEEYTQRIEELNERLIVSNSQLAAIKETHADIEALPFELNKKLMGLHGKKIDYTKKLMEIEKSIDYYSNTKQCLTCKQPISESFKDETLGVLISRRRKGFECLQPLDSEIAAVEKDLVELRTKTQQFQILKDEMKMLSSEINKYEMLIQELSRMTTSITETVDIESLQEQIEKKETEAKQLHTTLEHHQDNQAYLNFCQTLLKDDGIKTLIIKEYLPQINSILNGFLEKLDMTIGFEFDEFFNEKIREPGKENFTYESFSDGQKLKIDIALLFTWREIARLKNSLRMNVLFCDEIFDASLDNQNTELAVSLLDSLSSDLNIFVISHKTDLFETKVDRVIQLALVNNATKLTLM